MTEWQIKITINTESQSSEPHAQCPAVYIRRVYPSVSPSCILIRYAGFLVSNLCCLCQNDGCYLNVLNLTHVKWTGSHTALFYSENSKHFVQFASFTRSCNLFFSVPFYVSASVTFTQTHRRETGGLVSYPIIFGTQTGADRNEPPTFRLYVTCSHSHP